MGTIFSSAPGKVVRIPDGRPAVSFRFDIGLQSQRMIVTQAAIEQNGNYQFLHTIEDFIYVYVFGDKISEMQVSGLAFSDMCSSGGGNGMVDALSYYDQNKLASRSDPVKILFGTSSFEGFLTGSKVEIVKPEISLGQFAFRFHIFPNAANK